MNISTHFSRHHVGRPHTIRGDISLAAPDSCTSKDETYSDHSQYSLPSSTLQQSPHFLSLQTLRSPIPNTTPSFNPGNQLTQNKSFIQTLQYDPLINHRPQWMSFTADADLLVDFYQSDRMVVESTNDLKAFDQRCFESGRSNPTKVEAFQDQSNKLNTIRIGFIRRFVKVIFKMQAQIPPYYRATRRYRSQFDANTQAALCACETENVVTLWCIAECAAASTLSMDVPIVFQEQSHTSIFQDHGSSFLTAVQSLRNEILDVMLAKRHAQVSSHDRLWQALFAFESTWTAMEEYTQAVLGDFPTTPRASPSTSVLVAAAGASRSKSSSTMASTSTQASTLTKASTASSSLTAFSPTESPKSCDIDMNSSTNFSKPLPEAPQFNPRGPSGGKGLPMTPAERLRISRALPHYYGNDNLYAQHMQSLYGTTFMSTSTLPSPATSLPPLLPYPVRRPINHNSNVIDFTHNGQVRPDPLACRWASRPFQILFEYPSSDHSHPKAILLLDSLSAQHRVGLFRSTLLNTFKTTPHAFWPILNACHHSSASEAHKSWMDLMLVTIHYSVKKALWTIDDVSLSSSDATKTTAAIPRMALFLALMCSAAMTSDSKRTYRLGKPPQNPQQYSGPSRKPSRLKVAVKSVKTAWRTHFCTSSGGGQGNGTMVSVARSDQDVECLCESALSLMSYYQRPQMVALRQKLARCQVTCLEWVERLLVAPESFPGSLDQVIAAKRGLEMEFNTVTTLTARSVEDNTKSIEHNPCSARHTRENGTSMRPRPIPGARFTYHATLPGRKTDDANKVSRSLQASATASKIKDDDIYLYRVAQELSIEISELTLDLATEKHSLEFQKMVDLAISAYSRRS